MSADDNELLQEFQVESQEHLADIENQLLTLEAQGDDMDVALVNTVFRAIHSIKGAAGFMGLDTLGGLAHRAEEVLGRLRSSELKPTSLVINTLLRASDRLKELIDELENSNGQDVSSHIDALEKILSGDFSADAQPNQPDAKTRQPSNSPAEQAQPQATPDIASTTTAVESGQSNQESTLREFLVECFDNLEQIERDLLALEREPASESLINCLFRNMHNIKGASGYLGFAKLEQIAHAAENMLGGMRDQIFPMDPQISESLLGAIDVLRKLLHTIEATETEGVEDHQFTVDFLNAVLSVKLPKPAVSTASKPTQTTSARAVSQPTNTGSTAAPSSAKPVEKPAAKPTAEPAPVSKAAATPAEQPPKPDEKKSEPAKSGAQEVPAADSTIRVDVALLDKLMTRVGELVLARNQILQFNSTIEDAGLQNAVQRLNLITSELQEGVMKTRMQPIGNVWTKFPRLVRDLATMCNKQVRIEMEGKETELDKTIIEAIKDPLTHLVRNTVDHGIEKPEVRQQVGKPVEGCLTLRAFHEGGQVNIEIVDDGGGLNFERIRAKAIEKGLISSEEAARMPDRDVGNLIFLPGFSTAEQVSSVSGRGVGMDVVRTNIEKIGGSVDLQSQPGRGTTIKIRIPLTLAIVPALIVTTDGDRYAIPQVNLLELVRLEGELTKPAVEWIQGAPVYRLRGHLLPLVSLRGQLGLADGRLTGKEESLTIVVLKANDRQFGLVVDRVNDSEEIVVKPLGKQLKNVPIYSGTTIMGDGRVALILDVTGLAHSAKVISCSKEKSAADSSDAHSQRRTSRQSLLILSAGHDRRFALPLSQVTRLEKIAAKSIEHSRNREVVQYRGEIMPLIRLSESMGVDSTAYDSDVLDVVVYTQNERSFGLVVDRVLDIVDSNVAINARAGQAGDDVANEPPTSYVVQDHVTDLLDLTSLVGTLV